MRVRRDRDDQQIAERSRLLEVQEVTDVHEVESAVAMDDAAVAESLTNPRQLFGRDDFVARANSIEGSNHPGPPTRPQRPAPSSGRVRPAFTASSRNILTVSSENSARSFPTRSSFLRRSGVIVMIWHPAASAWNTFRSSRGLAQMSSICGSS